MTRYVIHAGDEVSCQSSVFIDVENGTGWSGDDAVTSLLSESFSIYPFNVKMDSG